MQRDPGSNPASPASNPHPLGLYPILAIVLALLVAGGCAARSRVT